MKRRTRLIVIGCTTLGGTIFGAAAAQAATAAPLDQTGVQITVKPGDTLSAIGQRTSRSWPQLAAFNHISNPNLIFVGQVITIPPASFVGQVSMPAAQTSDPPPSSAPSVAPASSTPAPAPVQTTSSPSTGGSPSGVWACIANAESGGNPSTNTGNGFYGMYQDTQSSWVAAGGLAYAPRADLASAGAQTIVNQQIQAQQGWGAWPNTSAACGA